jgi:hypothetical protein
LWYHGQGITKYRAYFALWTVVRKKIGIAEGGLGFPIVEMVECKKCLNYPVYLYPYTDIAENYESVFSSENIF